MTHGGAKGIPALKLQKLISEKTGKSPIRIGTWREPRQRFLSALHTRYRKSKGSISQVEEDLLSRKHFVDNAIYRYVTDSFGFDLNESPKEITTDYLIELGDHSNLSKIQSSFLSRNKLPNIIVTKAMNVTRSKYRMSYQEEKKLLKRFPIDSYVRLDESKMINSLRSSFVPSALDVKPIDDSLHPLTVLVSSKSEQSIDLIRAEIVLTSDLVNNEGRQKLFSFFR